MADHSKNSAHVTRKSGTRLVLHVSVLVTTRTRIKANEDQEPFNWNVLTVGVLIFS